MLFQSSSALGRPEAGREVGRRAFRLADTSDARYEAAYLVSAGAIAEDRYAAAQFWLREEQDGLGWRALVDRFNPGVPQPDGSMVIKNVHKGKVVQTGDGDTPDLVVAEIDGVG